MNIESGLISRIETKEDLLLILDERITKDFFSEHGEVFQAILDYHTKYSTVPERETLASFFPNYQFSDSNEPIEFFVDKIKEKYKKNIYNKGLIEVAELMKEDIDKAEKKMHNILSTSKTAIKSGSDLVIGYGASAKKDEYIQRMNNLGIDGYETPWSKLNDLTGGYHKGELIVWTAKPKMCKTWLLIWQAIFVWMNCGIPVVFITKEMTPKAIQDRINAILSKLPYRELKRGLLSAEQQKAYFKFLEKQEEDMKEGRLPEFRIHGYDLADGTAGVSSLTPMVERYLLDGGILFVDGLYLLPDDKGEKDWKAIVNISSDLKNLALSYNIPIIATTQHNMEDKSDIPRFDGAAYGKYLIQFVDSFLGIGRNDSDRELHTGRLYMLGQREGETGNFPINMKFNPIDFSQTFEKFVDDSYKTDENDMEY